MAPALDHIVILVPHDTLQALPAWLADTFTVVVGGQHAGGVTENKLILLQDGVYLELIAFVDPGDEKSRQAHRWGAQPDGHIIDWALSLAGSPDEADAAFRQIQDRVRTAEPGLAYHDLVPGGRTTPDGVVIKWATASPAALPAPTGTAPRTGGLPFWCLDRTPRPLRVPYTADGGRLARHPSAAVGVAGVTIHVTDEELLGRLARVYTAVLGAPVAVEANEWAVGVPEATAHGQTARVKVVQGAEAKIELALFTTGPSRTVQGQFVDGWSVAIRLEHVE